MEYMPYKDPVRQREFNRLWIASRRAEWFADKVCVVCGTGENLVLDHVDPSKKVSHRIWSWSAVRREAELAKCQALCEQHHKEKTVQNGETNGTANGPGEQHGTAKLTEADVRAIRKSLDRVSVLAAQYGVYTATISKIQKRQRWTHVA